ncbi:MAG: LamG domain-containing protein, partial [Schleiferiaceae bacterium]|nr:LamG domain-containing protein [Schleiferiaceae bacterium]
MKKLYILFSLSLVCLTVKPQNTALDFDGVDDHIEVPHSNTLNLNDFTLEAWVKTTSTGANERIISKNSGANQCYTLVVDNGLVAVAFNTAGGGNNVSGAISMNDGNWHHIAGVRNASTNTLSIFVDGVLDNSTGTTGIPVTGTEPLNIGRFPTNIQYFDGQMDEVRIWGRALTQSDILTNINQTLVGNESDLVAYYNFEEGTPNGDNSASGSNVTQVIDKAGANGGGVNNFTRNGSSSNWVNGKPFSEGNTVLDFDGGDNIEVPHDNSFNLDDFTLEAWVKTTSAGANERIITKTAGASQSFSLFVDNGLVGVGFSTGGGGNFMSGSISMNDGNWHHIAGVRNASSNTLSLYVDGVLDNSISTTGTPVTGTDPLNIGRFSSADPTKQRYNGQMDEVRIWNTALSQSDLQSRMTTPLAGDEVGLVAYFPFEEGVGNEDNSSLGAILDMAGGNTGTPIGCAQTGNSSNWISETSFITTSANTNVAMDFDGVDDFIDIPNNASLALDDFTLEAWVNTTSTVAYSRVIAKPSGGFANYSLMVHNGIVGVGFDTGLLNNYIYGSTTVNDGNWHHIVGVRSASTNMLYIYVDGMLDVSSSTTGTPLISTESLRIGLFGGAYAQRYQGRLDEIRIWNRALDQKEIVSNMNQTLMGSETGLVAYYKLEEGTPNGDNSATGGNVTQVIDQTGTNNGTVYSFARNGSSSNWVNGKAFSDGNTALDFDGVN